MVTYPYVDFGKQNHISWHFFCLVVSEICMIFKKIILSKFWMLQVWKLVSTGYSLPICLSSLTPFQTEIKCPTSPHVSPLTHPWWWASCLHIQLPISHHSAETDGKLFIICLCCVFLFFFCLCVYVAYISGGQLRAVGALLKCLDRRRVGVELEDSSVGVPILQFHAYTL